MNINFAILTLQNGAFGVFEGGKIGKIIKLLKYNVMLNFDKIGGEGGYKSPWQKSVRPYPQLN